MTKEPLSDRIARRIGRTLAALVDGLIAAFVFVAVTKWLGVTVIFVEECAQ